MTTAQGSLALLDDPVAQRLLTSALPARLAYVWDDGTPRVVPIGFHWNGHELVLGTPPDAPKAHALRDGAAVAVTIDSDSPPWKVLLIRGTVALDLVDGIAPEYAEMSIRVTPTWVGILDFETRFPSAIERAMSGASTSGAG